MRGRVGQAGAALLRGFSLASRFALTLGLAAIVSPAQMGVFGLYWAGLQLASSLMGFDVYATTTRELLRPGADHGATIRRHIGFMLLVALITTPLATIAFGLSAPAVPAALVVIFFLQLPAEYYCQEFSRLLVPLNRPFQSTLILFIRSALWTPLPFGLIVLFPQVAPVVLVAISWFFGTLAAAITTAVVVKRATGSWNFPKIDSKWAKTAVLSSGVFFLGSLVFRGMLGFDRFLVNGVLGIEVVGIYTVQASACLGALALVESGISAWWYPRLVNEIQADDVAAASRTFRGFLRNGVASALLLVSAIVVAFKVAAPLLINPVYSADLAGFYAMAAGVFLYASSMPYHYVLYGRGQDRKILCIYVVAAIVMSAWALTMMKGMGVAGAGCMLGIALGAIAGGRVLAVGTRVVGTSSDGHDADGINAGGDD
jgi:O-antigen/teichoic acid export membrane protein